MLKNNLMLKNSLNNYVVTSRIRLARNVEGFKFPPAVTIPDAEKVVGIVSKPLEENGFKTLRLKELSELEICRLKENHLISSGLIDNKAASAVCVNGDADMSVMINEEDHLRLQVILQGLELEEAYTRAAALDDYLAKSVQFVYDDRLGFITSCPTNLGTGLRASVMMFLPALNLSGTIGNVVSSLSVSKMTLRGIYGEGSKADGFMYQLSNQHTLGLSEQEIVSNVLNCIHRIALAEEQARITLYQNNKAALTDRIMRAWGILSNCFMISSAEFTELISYVKLGIGIGLIKNIKTETIDTLITNCQPASLTGLKGAAADGVERDIKRAEYLRETLG